MTAPHIEGLSGVEEGRRGSGGGGVEKDGIRVMWW